MRVNAFERLLAAVEERKQAHKDLVRACQDLANRIAKIGRVHDSVKRGDKHYMIVSAVQDLVDAKGRERESKPIKVLAIRDGDFDWDTQHHSLVQDTRRLVSLSPLMFDHEELSPLRGPHDATEKAVHEAIRDGYLGPEDAGAMIFGKTMEQDYSDFAEEAALVVQAFATLYEEQAQENKSKTGKLKAQVAQLDSLVSE